MGDCTETLAARVRLAAAAGTPLRIVGGDSRRDYGRRVEGEALDLAGHAGIVRHDPSELVITVRAGTPVAEVEAVLAEHQQILAFEPPSGGTIGGMIATGLAGQRRPFTGAVRDYVLGARVLDGRGEALQFGGTVFKNVAGFDAFRLMAGSMGCLGVILEVSLRVAPKPRAEVAKVYEMAPDVARAWVAALMRRPLPLSGAAHDGTRLHLRFSGGEAAVTAAVRELGGMDEPLSLWAGIGQAPGAGVGVLWRISVGPTTELPVLEGEMVWDWGGAQRWLTAKRADPAIWDVAAAVGGHATLVRGTDPLGRVFQPLPAPMLALHQRLKAAMDPAGVLNPGRMYEEL